MTTNDWQKTLLAQGAVIQDNAIIHFGHLDQELNATLNSNILCDLSHLGLLEISGEDAVTFLQGQVTNDVKQLNGSNAHYTGYCSPKGRLLALFLAFAHNNHIHLQLPRSLLEPISKRLKMYVMRSKVSIIDTSESIFKLGLNGPDVTKILGQLIPNLPTNDYELTSTALATVLKLPSIGNQARYEVLTDAEHINSIWSSLSEKCQLVGKACWDYVETNAGIPEIVPNTQEQFVPQMINLDILNGINFKKGCYTGQEIVARTHYLGSVKRRTFLASITSSQMPFAGDKILDANKNEVGQIVRVAPNTKGGADALMELRIEAQQNGEVFWQDIAVEFKTLPYSLVGEGA
ncbi:MAG: CAF17-like 4Fe-4S cluster assembly/insertion protein YgfZ [Methylophilus sp.]